MAKLRSINPYNGKEIGSVKITTKAEVEDTVKKSRLALVSWRQVGLLKRGKILLKAASLIEKNQKKLAEMITKEVGKPIGQAMDEVSGSASDMKYLVKKGYEVLRDEVLNPDLSKAQKSQMKKSVIADAVVHLAKGKTKLVDVVRYDAVGVVAAIKPWNFPIGVTMTCLTPALLAGNTVVLKPSENVSLVSQELIKLMYQAGVPKDVLQAIYGRSQVGEMLVDSEIDMVSFTGSSEVGKEIAQKCSKRLIKCVLGMGGSSPAIVLKDADLDLAVNKIVDSKFYNCGQVCDAIKRVFVEEPVLQEFTDKIVDRVKLLKVGDPMDKETEVGPLVSDKQLKKLQAQVTKGVVQSGRILAGGRRMREEPYLKGWFHEPTLMTYIGPKNDIMKDEIFGPVLPVGVVSGLKQAIKYANNSSYGLSAAIFTKNKKNYLQAVDELEAGAVMVNEVDSFDVRACSGGVKDSGVGTELGKHGIWEYTQKKHIKVNLELNSKQSYWYDHTTEVVEEK